MLDGYRGGGRLENAKRNRIAKVALWEVMREEPNPVLDSFTCKPHRVGFPNAVFFGKGYAWDIEFVDRWEEIKVKLPPPFQNNRTSRTVSFGDAPEGTCTTHYLVVSSKSTPGQVVLV